MQSDFTRPENPRVEGVEGFPLPGGGSPLNDPPTTMPQSNVWKQSWVIPLHPVDQ